MTAEDGHSRANERFLRTDLYHRRKLKIVHPVAWPHHRGGWSDVTAFLDRELSCGDGVLTINALEEVMVSGRVLAEPWVGFSHEVPRHQYRFPDLARLQELDTWKASKRYCLGLWVLSNYNKTFWETLGLPFPVSFVHYPVADPTLLFDFSAFTAQKRAPLLFVGEYLREVQPFFDLRAPGYQKIFLRIADDRGGTAGRQGQWPVTVIERVSDEEYDRLLSFSIVFLNLRDAGANTTIAECIARGTPVLVNRIGGVSEYLGDDYPLYYASLEEATAKLADPGLLARAAQYLSALPTKRRLSFENFGAEIESTAIYRNLPIPRSQSTRFRRFDLTVMVCCYKRIACLPELLERLARQDFTGSFEVLIWNNNFAVTDEIQSITVSFSGRLAIRSIHSTDNLYCSVRFAAPTLMRSETLMICDDDVLPEPGYLRTFWEKHLQYGDRTAICARGHTFLPHKLDTNNPEAAWREESVIGFHNEADEEQEIHFLHADNCLISRKLLKEAAQADLEMPDFVLVDDYWLSYVLCHKLDGRIVKIKADKALRFHLSADDARIAMFENSLVREQRVNFYVYHMLRGWPAFEVTPDLD